ncbi:MAG: hypothetical protein QM689_05105 [Oscillospiraceae bacterium]
MKKIKALKWHERSTLDKVLTAASVIVCVAMPGLAIYSKVNGNDWAEDFIAPAMMFVFISHLVIQWKRL